MQQKNSILVFSSDGRLITANVIERKGCLFCDLLHVGKIEGGVKKLRV